jgi:hypothetical protein
MASPQPDGIVAYAPPAVPELAEDGTALVALTIRANGRVDDAVALSATQRSLATAALDAVMQWRFARDPASRGRDATPDELSRREVVEFDFRRQGVITTMTHLDSAKTWFPESREPEVYVVLRDELDTPLVQHSSAPTAEAAALVESIPSAGSATVSYVIDEAGAVRVPAVIASDDPFLARAALALIRTWRYEPPVHRGESVLVEDRKTLTFAAGSASGDR